MAHFPLIAEPVHKQILSLISVDAQPDVVKWNSSVTFFVVAV